MTSYELSYLALILDGSLDADPRQSARKAYRLWAENPFHPSLRFKCINQNENIWTNFVSPNLPRIQNAIGIKELLDPLHKFQCRTVLLLHIFAAS